MTANSVKIKQIVRKNIIIFHIKNQLKKDNSLKKLRMLKIKRRFCKTINSSQFVWINKKLFKICRI